MENDGMIKPGNINSINESIKKYNIIKANTVLFIFVGILTLFGFLTNKDRLDSISSSKSIMLLFIVVIIMTVVSLTINLICSYKIKNLKKEIDLNQYEKCGVCRKYKLKGVDCIYSHAKDNKNIFMPSIIIMTCLVLLMILYFIFFQG